jgi:hypothetical protein
MEKLTDWEREYIFTHMPNKSADYYYDNPGDAVEDIEFLIKIIRKLTEEGGDDGLNEDINRFNELI